MVVLLFDSSLSNIKYLCPLLINFPLLLYLWKPILIGFQCFKENWIVHPILENYWSEPFTIVIGSETTNNYLR